MSERSGKNTGCILPVSRIRTIMKSSPGVSSIGQESLFLITKATEHFIGDLAQQIYQKSPNKKDVEYNTLAKIVAEDETLQFLQDTVPKKVLVRDILNGTATSTQEEDT